MRLQKRIAKPANRADDEEKYAKWLVIDHLSRAGLVRETSAYFERGRERQTTDDEIDGRFRGVANVRERRDSLALGGRRTVRSASSTIPS